MADRSYRSFENLERSASTARVLNLLKIYREKGKTSEWQDRPLFFNPKLNRCLIIKHRLRRNEYDRFQDGRSSALKIVIPIDGRDLKNGGMYIFVDQINYESAMREVFGITPDQTDWTVLSVLEKLPSLDPFLMREQLARLGVSPAECYFVLSNSDLHGMLEFVKAEIRPLVQLSMASDGVANLGSVERMATKILSNTPDDHIESLGRTLRLSREQYHEGIFCWKGFLYYKWSLNQMIDELASVSKMIGNLKPDGPADVMALDYIDRSRKFIRAEIARTFNEVRETLKVYDTAYGSLTLDGNPMAFRTFLLEAPSMFQSLGEQIGALQHVISFSRYRFSSQAAPLGSDELMEILMDFEASLRSVGDDGTTLI